MFLRLVILALMLMIAIGCGSISTEKPDSTQGESQPVVESPKSATAVPPTAVPPTSTQISESSSNDYFQKGNDYYDQGDYVGEKTPIFVTIFEKF